jgi:hypothetical protein
LIISLGKRSFVALSVMHDHHAHQRDYNSPTTKSLQRRLLQHRRKCLCVACPGVSCGAIRCPVCRHSRRQVASESVIDHVVQLEVGTNQKEQAGDENLSEKACRMMY